MSYSAKTTKKILLKKREVDHSRKIKEQKQKELKALEIKNREKLENELNKFTAEVVDSILSGNKLQFDCGGELDSDIEVELINRGFSLKKRYKSIPATQSDKNNMALGIHNAICQIYSLCERCQRIDSDKANSSNFIVPQYWDRRDLENLINISNVLNISCVNDSHYVKLKNIFDKILQNNIFYRYLDDNFGTVSGSIVAQMRKIATDLGEFRISLDEVLDTNILRWKESRTCLTIDPDYFLSASNMRWLASLKSKNFIEEVLELIQIAASNGSTFIFVSFFNNGMKATITMDRKKLIHLPFSIESLINFFECLGYKITIEEEQVLKEPGSLRVSWD